MYPDVFLLMNFCKDTLGIALYSILIAHRCTPTAQKLYKRLYVVYNTSTVEHLIYCESYSTNISTPTFPVATIALRTLY